jgi:hypothetical protein
MRVSGDIKLWIITDVNNPFIVPIDESLSGKLRDGKDDIVMQIDNEFYAKTWDDDTWVKLALHSLYIHNDRYFTKY